MLKILNTKQIKELDAYTIEHEPIASIDLMERACRAFVDWFIQYIEPQKKIGIVCGTGNNGGDGLGIARILKDWNYPVKVWVVRGLVPESEDFKKNLQRISGSVEIADIKSEIESTLFGDNDVLIDAIFGSGLSRPTEGLYAHVINAMNETNALRVAVDIPSGLSADLPSPGEIVRAHYTVTFQLPKLAFFFPESYAYTGEWIIVDIGLSKQFIRKSESSIHFVRLKDARRILKPRGKFDHKGNYGHALLVAGSHGKMGAAVLASRAALRAGLGLLTVRIPKCGYSIIQTSVPEAMADVDHHENFFSNSIPADGYTTVGIGPGLGQDPLTVKAFILLLEKFQKPMVIDADALNILSAHREFLKHVPPNSILTPHPKEFERLAGGSANSFERIEKQKELSARLQSFVVLKGAFTSISTPEGLVYFNSTGNPGMATGGSGDVLTGILTGLLAQNYSSREAAILGTFLHGLAGDIACNEKGVDSIIASDVIDCLSGAFLKLDGK
jgi:ADP-dependent NAD(P)H-hydrate dehydratase / NAD(P)H-hydrate epimerase